jgi:hypothetical protein
MAYQADIERSGSSEKVIKPDGHLREQIADQCKVVAALADIISKVNSDYERMLRDPECGPRMGGILDIVGKRTACLMEYLGDTLDGMDAVTDEDAWMTPIFEKAHELFPCRNYQAAYSPAPMTISNESGSDAVSLKSDTSLPPQSIEGE